MTGFFSYCFRTKTSFLWTKTKPYRKNTTSRLLVIFWAWNKVQRLPKNALICICTWRAIFGREICRPFSHFPVKFFNRKKESYPSVFVHFLPAALLLLEISKKQTAILYGNIWKFHVRERWRIFLESKLFFAKGLWVLYNSEFCELFSEKIVTDFAVSHLLLYKTNVSNIYCSQSSQIAAGSICYREHALVFQSCR